MKKLFLSILFCLLFCGNLFSDVVLTVGDDFHFTVVYHSSGTHQTGKTINLSIKRTSDSAWYDFDDSSFKSSGWTTKTQALTEDTTNNNYHYTWSDQGGDTGTNVYVFQVECSSEFIAEETVMYTILNLINP